MSAPGVGAPGVGAPGVSAPGVPDIAWRALEGAAAPEAIAENIAAWRRWRLVPRAFRTRTETDLSLTLFGVRLAHPVLAAPVALADAGRLGTAAALAAGAAKTGSSLVLSASAHHRADEVGRHLSDGWFAQVYLPEDRELIRPRLAALREHGARAAFLTVDQLNITYQQPFRAWALALPADVGAPPFGVPASSLSLDDIAFVADATGLPVVVKGILHPEDAAEAVAAGAAGVVVSNHGGRQIAGSVTAAEQLADVVAAVAGRAPVLVDSGIREARDVAVALALGASAVLIGRPLVAAAWRGGEDAVAAHLSEIADELRGALTLAGVPDLAGIGPGLLRHADAACAHEPPLHRAASR